MQDLILAAGLIQAVQLTQHFYFGFEIFTSQLTPNLSVSIPNESPQGGLARDIVTVPPSECF
jgi:hypothetical protein